MKPFQHEHYRFELIREQQLTFYTATVIADSVNPKGERLTSLEVRLPRILLAELNTHRRFSRVSASSRAIPVARQLQAVRDRPFIPLYWGAAESGMQAHGEVSAEVRQECLWHWSKARQAALAQAEALLAHGLHKQIPNRLLEPFAWHVVLVTASSWSNFVLLRDNGAAEPHMQIVASRMREALEQHKPDRLEWGEWHLPYVNAEERYTFDGETARMLSAGRSARVSVDRQNVIEEAAKSRRRAESMLGVGHMSPFEHQAQAAEFDARPGNFHGSWNQLRKLIPGEENILAFRGEVGSLGHWGELP